MFGIRPFGFVDLRNADRPLFFLFAASFRRNESFYGYVLLLEKGTHFKSFADSSKKMYGFFKKMVIGFTECKCTGENTQWNGQ